MTREQETKMPTLLKLPHILLTWGKLGATNVGVEALMLSPLDLSNTGLVEKKSNKGSKTC